MAMFDYTGAEADELSFREGDVLIQVNPSINLFDRH